MREVYELNRRQLVFYEELRQIAVKQSDEKDLKISYPAVDLMFLLFNERQVPEKILTENYHYPAEVVKMIVNRVAANSFKNELPPMCEVDL